MREEVISSGTMDPLALGMSASPPPTPAASSAGASSPAVQTNIGSFGSAQGSKIGSSSRIGSTSHRASLSTNAGVSARGSSKPSCRPWERGDLLRRLATFKPSDWFEKPKEISSLACARRGWRNIDTDKIECELCGAQLIFNALATWTSAEVNSAGEAFAEQLDASHKVTCPWRGNCCADSLVQFPPTPPSALIEGYKDRCDGLLQFPSLPSIASSAIEKMRLSRSIQIDRFLSQLHTYSSGDFGLRAENTPGIELSLEDTFCIYYHAQKLISLCGWEPRWLPNVQDYEEHSTQSARNAFSFDPTEEQFCRYQHAGTSKNYYSASVIKETGKEKKYVQEFKCNSKAPLLDCSLCGATVRIWDFLTVPRPARFGVNNLGTPDASKKMVLTRGVSAASGINGCVDTDGMEKEQAEGRDEAATTDEGKSLSNACVDLNLTIAGGLPSKQPMPAMSEHFDDGGMGRDLMIGQPAGSEVGNHAASYESRGPSARKRGLEEGGSTADRPLGRVQQADSIEGTIIDRDGDEVDDIQYSDGLSKRARARGLDIFDTYHSSCRIDSFGAGPSRSLCFEIDIDVNRVDSFKEGSDLAAGLPYTKESARASSVIAMDTVGHNAEEDSTESVENYPGDDNDVHFHFPSPSTGKNIDMNEALEFSYSIQAQQSTCVRPASGSVVREMGVSSTNEGEEILNAETVNAPARDRVSFGISGGSVGMGASHEAEIHGIYDSIQSADSTVGDAEPIAEVTENLGQTGESAPGPGLMDEFVPEEMDREDPHGDSQDVISRSVGKADSGSKIYGSTKGDSVESGKKVNITWGHESSAHPSLSCNALICSGYEASKEEVTQKGKASITDECTFLNSERVPVNDENDYEVGGEFDPIKHHNVCCPWVNGNVAAAGCGNDVSSSCSFSVALCGWELTLDALDAFHFLGHIPNQTMQSESAASLYKDDHLTSNQKLLSHHSVSKNKGQL